VNASLSYRDCKCLSDALKKEYLENVELVEKAVLRAVISFSLILIIWEKLCLSVYLHLKQGD
jgi:hypothetical protein